MAYTSRPTPARQVFRVSAYTYAPHNIKHTASDYVHAIKRACKKGGFTDLLWHHFNSNEPPLELGIEHQVAVVRLTALPGADLVPATSDPPLCFKRRTEPMDVQTFRLVFGTWMSKPALMRRTLHEQPSARNATHIAWVDVPTSLLLQRKRLSTLARDDVILMERYTAPMLEDSYPHHCGRWVYAGQRGHNITIRARTLIVPTLLVDWFAETFRAMALALRATGRVYDEETVLSELAAHHPERVATFRPAPMQYR